MSVFSEIWHRASAVQPAPDARVVWTTAAVAAALVIARPLWRWTRHLVTIAHEGAHGVAALLTGRRLTGIRLHSDTSGLTLSSGRPDGLGMMITVAAGYLGPGLLGLGAAALLGAGHAVGVLWALLVLLTLLLLQIRNWFGLWSVLVTAAVLVAVTWWLPADGQSAVAYLVTWFLLISAPRPVLELQGSRRRGRTRDSDADQLARITGPPGLIWVGVFLAVTSGTLALGVRWLMP